MNKTLAEDQAETVMRLAELPEDRRKAVLGFATGLVMAYKTANPEENDKTGKTA